MWNIEFEYVETLVDFDNKTLRIMYVCPFCGNRTSDPVDHIKTKHQIMVNMRVSASTGSVAAIARVSYEPVVICTEGQDGFAPIKPHRDYNLLWMLFRTAKEYGMRPENMLTAIPTTIKFIKKEASFRQLKDAWRE